MNKTTFNQVAVVLLFLVLWEILPRSGLLNSQFIPPLSTVLATIQEQFVDGDLTAHILISLKRAYVGLFTAVMVGLPLGLLLGGWFPRLEQGVEPLMELFAQANPIILAHIIIFFIGIGEPAKTFIISWLCIWPIAFSTISGIRTVDQNLLKAARAFGLGRWKLFVRVVLPASAPSIFTGLRLAAGYAFIMLIASEMMGASSGLGWLVVQSQVSYHAPRIFAGASIITFLAVVTDLLIKLIERKVVVWNDNSNEDFLKLQRGAEL